MNSHFKNYEEQLYRFSILYMMFGYIEHELRRRTVVTLSNLAKEKGYAWWFQLIPERRNSRVLIRKAIKLNRGSKDGFEYLLPFTFWRNLFIRENFTNLWIPALHKIFEGIEEAKRHEKFKDVCAKIKAAHEIRNRLAHYNFRDSRKFEDERADLAYLIQALQSPAEKFS